MTRRCTTTSMYLPGPDGRGEKVSLASVGLWSRDPLSGQVVRISNWKDLARLERRGERAGGFDGRVVILERGSATRARAASLLRYGPASAAWDETGSADGGRMVRTDSRQVRNKSPLGPEAVLGLHGVEVTELPWERARPMGAAVMVCQYGRIGPVGQRVALRSPRTAYSVLSNTKHLDPVIWRSMVVELDDERFCDAAAGALCRAEFFAGVGTATRLGSDDALRVLERWASVVRESSYDGGIAGLLPRLPAGTFAGQDRRVLSWRMGIQATDQLLFRSDLTLSTRLELARRVTPMMRYRWLGQTDPTELSDQARYPTETLVELMVDGRSSATLNREFRAWAADVFAARADVSRSVVEHPNLPVELLGVLARVGFQPELTDQLITRILEADVKEDEETGRDEALVRQARRLLEDRASLRLDQRERLGLCRAEATRSAPTRMPDLEALNDAQIEELMDRCKAAKSKFLRDGRTDDLLTAALAVGERLHATNPRLASRLGHTCLDSRAGPSERARPVAAARACGVVPKAHRTDDRTRPARDGDLRPDTNAVLDASLETLNSPQDWMVVSEHLEAAFGSDRMRWQVAFGVLEDFTGSARDLTDVVVGVLTDGAAGR